MLRNRYFIANVPNPNMSQIYDLVVGSESTQRFSLDGTKVMVKLPLGDEGNHGVLSTAIEYTHSEIIAELQKPEWSHEVL